MKKRFLPWVLPALLAFSLPGSRAQEPAAPANVLENGGFEEMRDGKPAGWILAGGGACAITEERARTGKRSLRMVDASPKGSADADAARKPLPAGKHVAVRLWCYLEEGKPGLGVYVR